MSRLYLAALAALLSTGSAGAQSTSAPVAVPAITVNGNATKDAERTFAFRPEYPPLAHGLAIEGSVTVSVWINNKGKPRKTAILKREPVHADFFDDAARVAAMKSHYLPAMRDGRAVAGWISAPFNFTLEGGGVTPRIVKLDVADYPQEGLEQGVEGWVSVLVPTNAFGVPDESRIAIRSRYPAYFHHFDAKAKAAAAKSIAAAGVLQPRTLSSWALVRVDFQLPAE